MNEKYEVIQMAQPGQPPEDETLNVVNFTCCLPNITCCNYICEEAVSDEKR